ncbi:uncharacterized protein UHOD_01545 [Ustilago sp. UG-2017b]|nr:uncharacterized protein UHOD_01545 [Ustilago sp. UG-2017b]
MTEELEGAQRGNPPAITPARMRRRRKNELPLLPSSALFEPPEEEEEDEERRGVGVATAGAARARALVAAGEAAYDEQGVADTDEEKREGERKRCSISILLFSF